MIRLFFILLTLLSMPALADNEVLIDQVGDHLEMTILQQGDGNIIRDLNFTNTKATVSGNNKTVKFTMIGDNNTVKTWSHGGNQFLDAYIEGDGNIIAFDNHGNNNKLYYTGYGDYNSAWLEIGNGGDNDNQIELWQSGDNHYAYLETDDDYNDIDAYQGNGQDDNYLKIILGGNSNDVTAWQGKHSDGTTDADEVGDHEGYWIVNGDSNVLKSYQTDTNRSNGGGAGHHFANYITGDSNNVILTQKGKAGHDGFIEIDGNSNTVDLYQKGNNGVKWADLVLDGNGHSLDVTQKGGSQATASIELFNGSAPYDLTLTQEATSSLLNYSISGTCYTAGGCTVSVSQSN